MLPVALILSGLGVMSISGFSYVWAASNPSAGQRLTVILFVFGSLIGLSGTVLALVQPDSTDLVITWTLPIGQFFVAVDPLSAFFLILIFTIPALGSIYSLSYWKQ